jgi:hypothetical protein
LTPRWPQALPSRPIHCCVDATGGYLLTAFNFPSAVTVHRINPDGTLSDLIRQPAPPDGGIFAHQIRTTPSNQSAILVTRGNNAGDGKPEDPGALKVFGFHNGVLTNQASIAPGTGLGLTPAPRFPPGNRGVRPSSVRINCMSRKLNQTRARARPVHHDDPGESGTIRGAGRWRHPRPS